MQIVAEYELEPSKETKGCHRYRHVSGDPGITTHYLRKDALRGQPAPKRLQMVLTPIDS